MQQVGEAQLRNASSSSSIARGIEPEGDAAAFATIVAGGASERRTRFGAGVSAIVTLRSASCLTVPRPDAWASESRGDNRPIESRWRTMPPGRFWSAQARW